MKRVIIESPYAGDVLKHVAYAQEALWDSLARGEAPLASHLLYTQVLDDKDPKERELGIEAGLAWMSQAEAVVAYIDHGWSPGMRAAVKRSTLPIIERRLHPRPEIEAQEDADASE